jgi:hypothetical protein
MSDSHIGGDESVSRGVTAREKRARQQRSAWMGGEKIAVKRDKKIKPRRNLDATAMRFEISGGEVLVSGYGDDR